MSIGPCNLLSYENMRMLGAIGLTSTIFLGCPSSASDTHAGNPVVVPISTSTSPNSVDQHKPKEAPRDTIRLWEKAEVRNYFQGDDEYVAITRKLRDRIPSRYWDRCWTVDRNTVNHGLERGEFRAYRCCFEYGKFYIRKINSIFPDSDRIILYDGGGGRTGIDYEYFGLRNMDGKFYPYRHQLDVTDPNEQVSRVDIWDVTDDKVSDIILSLRATLPGSTSLFSYRVFVGKMTDMKF